MKYLIGVDGGGSGCRALLADRGGTILGRGESGAANIVTDPDGSLAHIVEAARLACADAGLPPQTLEASSAVLGLAGANVGTFGARLEASLPFARGIVETDVATAVHGALGTHDGLVAITGTGSVFAAQSGGAIRTAGGWGFVIGDQASGARLGRALLEATLLALDGVRTGSEATDAAAARFERDPARMVEWAHAARPGDFATLAPLVFDHAGRGDPAAGTILRTALADLEEALAAIMPADCDRLCLLGGLASGYAGRLDKRFQTILAEPEGDALDGALGLAMQRFAATS